MPVGGEGFSKSGACLVGAGESVVGVDQVRSNAEVLQGVVLWAAAGNDARWSSRLRAGRCDDRLTAMGCGLSDAVMTLKSLLHRGVGSAVLTSLAPAQIASSCLLADGRLVCGGMSGWRSRSSEMKSSQRLGPPS